MYRYTIIFFFSLLYSLSVTYTQNSSEFEAPFEKTGGKNYIKSYFVDGLQSGYCWAAWEPKEWALFSGVVVASATAYRYDTRVNAFFEKQQHKTISHSTTYFFDPLGGKESFVGLALFTGIAHISNKPKAVETGMNAFKACMIAGVGSMAIKTIVQRPRPYTSEDFPLETNPFSRDFQSFPSGHTANSFAMATVFSQAYKDDYKALPYIAYSLASMVALARIYDNQHHLSDIIAGAAIGYIIGKTVSKKNNWQLDRNYKTKKQTTSFIAF